MMYVFIALFILLFFILLGFLLRSPVSSEEPTISPKFQGFIDSGISPEIQGVIDSHNSSRDVGISVEIPEGIIGVIYSDIPRGIPGISEGIPGISEEIPEVPIDYDTIRASFERLYYNNDTQNAIEMLEHMTKTFGLQEDYFLLATLYISRNNETDRNAAINILMSLLDTCDDAFRVRIYDILDNDIYPGPVRTNDTIIDIVEDPWVNDPYDNAMLQGLENYYTRRAGPIMLLQGGMEAVRLETVGYNDPQNVHDSGVVSTTKKVVKDLQKSTGAYGPGRIGVSEQEFNNFLASKRSDPKYHDVVKSMKSLKTGEHSTLGTSEKAAYNLVLNRINDLSQRNPSLDKNSLYDLLYSSFGDMQEHGSTVCSTGKITRIMGALNGVDPDIKIVPERELREEMYSKAAKVRTDSEAKGLSESATKDTIINELRKDYVESGIVTPEKFAIETSWIDDIY